MGQAFTHRIRVRYAECDPQGVVFNAHYYAYYDILITELWRAAIDGGYQQMLEEGSDLSVVESRARFFTPARFDDELDLKARIARLGNTAMSTAVEIARADGTVVVEGEIHHVFIDPATYRKRPIPDNVRAGLEPYLLAGAGAPGGAGSPAAGSAGGAGSPAAGSAGGAGSPAGPQRSDAAEAPA